MARCRWVSKRCQVSAAAHTLAPQTTHTQLLYLDHTNSHFHTFQTPHSPTPLVSVWCRPAEPAPPVFAAQVVSPITPRVQYGMYRGYDVRLASSLHAVVKACPYSKGYDLTIGTSGE